MIMRGRDARGPRELDPSVAEDGDTSPAKLGRKNETDAGMASLQRQN
jgi:hypothetical protein